MNFNSLVDRVGLAAVELFDELLFHLLHEERLARLRYGERGLYFVSAAEGDDAAAGNEQIFRHLATSFPASTAQLRLSTFSCSLTACLLA